MTLGAITASRRRFDATQHLGKICAPMAKDDP